MLGKVNLQFSFWVPGISVASISATVLLFVKQFIYIFRQMMFQSTKTKPLTGDLLHYSLNSIIIIIIIIIIIVI